MLTAELEAAYRSTHYVVDAVGGSGDGALVDPIVLEINVASPALLGERTLLTFGWYGLRGQVKVRRNDDS